MIIERGQVFVRALNSEGQWGSVDALDLDEESFRRMILTGFCKAGLLMYIESEGDPTPYRERPSE